MAKTKSGKAKLPKRIAGVKLPKELRRSPVAIALYSSDLVRDLVKSALLAGGAALANDERVRRTATAARGRAEDVAVAAVKTARRKVRSAAKLFKAPKATRKPSPGGRRRRARSSSR
jgi:hypothetical protein